MRTLRVLMLTTYFPKPANPVMGVWALEQARALARTGVDLRVVSFTSWVPRTLARSPRLAAWADCPARHDWGGVSVEYPRWPFYQVLPLKGWALADPRPQLDVGWPAARPALDAIVKSWRPDVVFAHHAAVSGYLAMRLRRRHRVPYVVTEHDLDEIRACRRFPKRRRLFREVAGGAASVVGVSSAMARDIRDVAPAARAVVVPNGSQLGTPRRDRGDGRVVVLCVGLFYERKAVPLLVRAFAAAARRHPAAVLRVIGDGPERPAVERAVADSGLAGRVELLCRRPHAEVLDAMRAADVFALVGWDEPLATVHLEAAAAGLPGVWSADGGIAEVLDDGAHGLGVPPRDEAATAAALDRLLGDAELRRRLGGAAREHVARHLTWDANARRMRELFEAARR